MSAELTQNDDRTGLPQDATGDKPYLMMGTVYQTAGIKPTVYQNVDFDQMSWPQNAMTQALATGTIASAIPNPLAGIRILLPDGTSGNCALSWAHVLEYNSGFYRPSAYDYIYNVNGSPVTEWKQAEFRVNYLTPGQVVFPTTSGKLTGSSNFFWDNPNKFLGIGTSSPRAHIEVREGVGTPTLYLASSLTQYVSIQGGNGLSVAATGHSYIFWDFNDAAALDVVVSCWNTDNTDPASNAYVQSVVGGNSAGDPYYRCVLDSPGTAWSFGLDNSDSDKWKLSRGFTLGTNDRFTVTTAGVVAIPALTAGSVLFIATGGLISENNASFFWDNANARLGVGTNAPARPIHVYNTSTTVAPVIGYTNPQGTWHVGPFGNQDTFSIARSSVQAYMNIDGPTLANSDGNVAFNTTATSGASATFRFHIRGAPVSTDITKEPTLFFLEAVSANGGDGLFRAACQSVTGHLDLIEMVAKPTSYALASFANTATGSATSDCIVQTGVGDGTSGDPYFRALVIGVTNWAWGIRNSDSDKFYLCSNASGDLATNSWLTVTTAGFIGSNTTTPRAVIDSLSTGAEQLRLTYTDNSVYTFLRTLSTGYLNIQNTGGKVQIGAPGTPVIATQLEVYNAGSVGWTVRDTTNSREVFALTNSNGGNIGTGSNHDLLILTNTAQAARFTNLQSAIMGKTGMTTGSTDGFIYIPSAAGAPVGTPTAQTGFIPLYYDSTNNFLYVYNGGGWKKSTVYA
jgi:hypothetical protein